MNTLCVKSFPSGDWCHHPSFGLGSNSVQGCRCQGQGRGPAQAEEFEACCTWFDPDLMQPSAVGYSLQAQQSSLVVQFLLADGPAGPAGHGGGRDPGQGELRGGGSSRVCLWRQGCESASQVGEFAAAAGGQASQDHGACGVRAAASGEPPLLPLRLRQIQRRRHEHPRVPDKASWFVSCSRDAYPFAQGHVPFQKGLRRCKRHHVERGRVPG